ncbi:hypothetical protein BGX26_011120, partial [Mortierella sp. AD094]
MEIKVQRLHEDAQKALDAAPTPVRQPIPMVLDGIVQDAYGLLLQRPTLQLIQSTRDRLHERQRLTFYSDGSLINLGTEQVSAAFGVTLMTDTGSFEAVISGRVDGYATSAIAELYGLLATIL